MDQQNNLGNRERLLWVTDTFGEHNGVSTVLGAVLTEIRLRDLPVDLMVCSQTLVSGEHLIVVPQVAEFTLPLYRHQPFRIPNYLAVQRAFRRGGYSRIMCSTEGPLGMAALWLKKRFGAETFFFLHTDWLMFAREVLGFEDAGIRRLELILRAYYRQFSKVFVLNREHQGWLTRRRMGFAAHDVCLTAHWADPIFSTYGNGVKPGFPFDAERPVVLYTGRISREKGVMDLPRVMEEVRNFFPEVQLVVAGTGPAESDLKAALPEAVYLGWVGHEDLPGLYRSADLLLLPSRFDTFSCVVLEALSSGLPVIAYNTKGPRDILDNSGCGYLVETPEEMAGKIISYFLDVEGRTTMRSAAFKRAGEYKPADIMDRLLADAGVINEKRQ